MALVALEAQLRASSLLQLDVPGPAIAGQGGAIILRIQGMPMSERIRIMQDAADDPLAVMFCLMTRAERNQLFQVAEDVLRDLVTKE